MYVSSNIDKFMVFKTLQIITGTIFEFRVQHMFRMSFMCAHHHHHRHEEENSLCTAFLELIK